MLERFRLDGEVAVITGGGNGIGRATAAAFVEAGAAVALLDRDEKAVKETENTLRAAVQKLKPILSTSPMRSRSKPALPCQSAMGASGYSRQQCWHFDPSSHGGIITC